MVSETWQRGRTTTRSSPFSSIATGRFSSLPTPKIADAARLSEYAGNYLSSIACRSCPREPDSIFTVEAKPDGTLSLWGQRWIPVGQDLFIRDDGRTYLGFARDPAGGITAVSGGSWRVADRIR